LWTHRSEIQRLAREASSKWKIRMDFHDSSIYVFDIVGISRTSLADHPFGGTSHLPHYLVAHYTAIVNEASWSIRSFLSPIWTVNTMPGNVVNICSVFRNPSEDLDVFYWIRTYRSLLLLLLRHQQ
jgi:hypothetical protein